MIRIYEMAVLERRQLVCSHVDGNFVLNLVHHLAVIALDQSQIRKMSLKVILFFGNERHVCKWHINGEHRYWLLLGIAKMHKCRMKDKIVRNLRSIDRGQQWNFEGLQIGWTSVHPGWQSEITRARLHSQVTRGKLHSYLLEHPSFLFSFARLFILELAFDCFP